MMNRYVFDVDGTLTPSRGIIDLGFKNWLLDFSKENPVYLVTGSDKPKTLEQIGEPLYNACKKVYQCSGNDVWVGNKNLYSKDFTMVENLFDDLNNILNLSEFHIKTGNHIEIRPGLCNFSIVGRNADLIERAKYCEWDNLKSEREQIVFTLSKMYDKIYDIRIAGETGIDIVMKGCDKAQIIHDFSPHDKIIFFGDKMNPGGNDYTLALEIAASSGDIHHVTGWEKTWSILKEYAK